MSNIRFLRTLLAIEQYGSFAAAADRIGLTQSAVSLQMNALEKEFGQVLFDRSRRTASLNRNGKAILHQVQNLVEQYDELRLGNFEPGVISGSVSIGTVVSAMGAISIVLANFKRQYPRLHIQLSTGKSNDLVESVLSGQLDCAVTIYSDSCVRPSLSWDPLYAEYLIVLAGRHLEGETARGLLETKPFLRAERVGRTGILVDKAIKAKNLKVNEFLEINSMETIAELVRQDIGVSILPLLRYASWKDDPRLVILPIEGARMKRTIGVVRRKGGQHQEITEVIKQRLMTAV